MSVDSFFFVRDDKLPTIPQWQAALDQARVGIVLEDVGVFPNDVLMDVTTWKIFRANDVIQQRLNIYRTIGALPTMAMAAQVEEGGVFMGTVDGFNIFVYSGWYIDPADGTQKSILPAKTVIMASPAMMGVQAFGAIRDEEVGLQATPYFVKSWIQFDPSVRYIMLQSAPLIVPFRPDASLAVKVLV